MLADERALGEANTLIEVKKTQRRYEYESGAGVAPLLYHSGQTSLSVYFHQSNSISVAGGAGEAAALPAAVAAAAAAAAVAAVDATTVAADAAVAAVAASRPANSPGCMVVNESGYCHELFLPWVTSHPRR